MKKLLFTCFIALSASVTASAQLTTYVLDNFENGHVNFTKLVNVNPPDNMDTAVVANPAPDAVNSTTKCWKWTRLDAGINNQPWAGFYATLATPIAAGCQTITLKFYRTNANSLLKLHCESSGSAEFFPEIAPAKVNQWEDLTFNVAANWTKSITILGLQPDYPADGKTIDIGAIMYIDEINFTTGSTGIFNPIENKLNAYFTNGEIQIPNYVGKISVSDITGKTVATGFVTDGKLRVSIGQGIYILKTTNGTAKIAVY